METVSDFISKNNVKHFEVYDKELDDSVWRSDELADYLECRVLQVYQHKGIPNIIVDNMNDDGKPGMFKPKWRYCSDLAYEAMSVNFSHSTCEMFYEFKKLISGHPISKKSLICRIINSNTCEIRDMHGEDYGGGPLSPPYDSDVDKVITELLISVIQDVRRNYSKVEGVILPSSKDKIVYNHYIACYYDWDVFFKMLNSERRYYRR